jgi:hypothetical protein
MTVNSGKGREGKGHFLVDQSRKKRGRKENGDYL